MSTLIRMFTQFWSPVESEPVRAENNNAPNNNDNTPAPRSPSLRFNKTEKVD